MKVVEVEAEDSDTAALLDENYGDESFQPESGPAEGAAGSDAAGAAVGAP